MDSTEQESLIVNDTDIDQSIEENENQNIITYGDQEVTLNNALEYS